MIITGLIYLTGGPKSPYSLAYLPYILAYSLLFDKRDSIKTSLSCIGAYILTSTLLMIQKIPLISGEYLTDYSYFSLITNTTLILSLSLIINYTIDYLTIKIVESNAEVVVSKHSLFELKEKYNQELEKLKSVQKQLIAQDKMAKLLSDTKKVELNENTNQNFVGESERLKIVFDLITKVSKTDSNILISGESGTGKELVARSIHNQSNRRHKPFIAINCSAIPENLLESEFFGYKKGAFTGANADSLGLFKMSEGGTLFLDEIGELPLHVQSKLLRAIQEKAIKPVGGTEELPINVRILSATNRNLFEETKKGTFREDLYYRINVVEIPLPALRERKQDIPLLVNHFINKFSITEQKPLVPPGTLRLLTEYNYPGNIRELENIIERAVILGSNAILPEHLPEYVVNFNNLNDKNKNSSNLNKTGLKPYTNIIEAENLVFPVKLDEILDTIEKRYLTLALQQTNGVRKKAAELLGINFRSFRYRIGKYEELDK